MKFSPRVLVCLSKSLEDDAIDIADMSEVDGPSFLMGRRF